MPRHLQDASRRFSSFLYSSLTVLLIAPSLWAADTTPPSAPGTPTEGSRTVDAAYSGTGNYGIYWTAATDPESGIAAYELQEKVGSTGSWTSLSTTVTGTGFAVTGRLDQTQYVYQVRAKNKVGLWGAWSASSNGILVDKTPPSPVTVTDDGSVMAAGSLHARWSASSDPESGLLQYEYLVKQDATGGSTLVPWTPIGLATEVTRSDLAFLSGKLYFVGVRAKNGAGLYAATRFSDGIRAPDATPPTAPGQPTEGSPTADLQLSGTGSYTVYWPAASDPESGIAAYELEERVGSGGGWTSLTTTQTKPSFSVTGRLDKTRYFYQVRARNNTGLWGPYSATSDGLLVDKTLPTPVTVTDDGATTPSTTQLHARWSASSDPESGIIDYRYQVRQDSATGLPIVPWTSSSNATEVTISSSGLAFTPGTRYFICVQARNGALLYGNSRCSDGILIATDTQAPQISAIGVTGITATGAVITWTADELSTSAVDYGATTAYGQTLSVPGLVSAHAVTLTGLSGLSTYHFRVRSSDASGNTSQSGDQTFETGNPGPSVVSISGHQLLVQKRNLDGTLGTAAPYIIRGVDWSPASRSTNTTPWDANNANVRRLEFGLWYQTDIPLMKAMNMNTVRLFIDPGFDATLGPIGRQVLDELYRNGIMVIMTVDDAINNTTRAQQVVSFYKDHPAILMWSLGSEWNINNYFGVASSVLDAAQRTQTAAALLKPLDANHPVATSYGEIDINDAGRQLVDTQNYVNIVCPSVDLWSLNIFRGQTFTTLFQQWASITTKPIFLGEFGVDAFHTTNFANPPQGAVNEAEQAQWDRSMWDDVARNLSARDGAKVALGGAVFEWNDEWWKVSPPGSQETGGWLSGGFPDGMGNEEYFGIVDIDRHPRQVYGTLTTVFDPAYVPPIATITFQAASRGAKAQDYPWQQGRATFYQNGTIFYNKTGGGGGGRGFNVAVVNMTTGQLLDAPRNFDTWGEGQPTDTALVNYLNGIPRGALVMLAVADEAGLTNYPPNGCVPRSYIEPLFQALEALGSTHIRSYCYQDSWAMVAVKGEGHARDEALGTAIEADAQTSVNLP